MNIGSVSSDDGVTLPVASEDSFVKGDFCVDEEDVGSSFSAGLGSGKFASRSYIVS